MEKRYRYEVESENVEQIAIGKITLACLYYSHHFSAGCSSALPSLTPARCNASECTFSKAWLTPCPAVGGIACDASPKTTTLPSFELQLSSFGTV